MDDILISLYVLLGAAALAALVFFLTRSADKKREKALKAYCAQNGYRLRLQREPTAREMQIEGEGWRLVSSMRALQSTADSGSSGWQCETEWMDTREDSARQTYALQISKGSADLDRLPLWIRDAAISAVRSGLEGDMLDLNSIRTAFYEGGRSVIALEAKPLAADAMLERLMVALREYHGGLPLTIESSPRRVRLRLPDAALRSAEEIDQLLRLTKMLL